MAATPNSYSTGSWGPEGRLALRIWWLGLLWWAVAHAVGLWAARADRRFFDVLRRHLALPGHLDA